MTTGEERRDHTPQGDEHYEHCDVPERGPSHLPEEWDVHADVVGTIRERHPRDAEHASRHYRLLLCVVQQPADTETERIRQILLTQVDTLHLSVRSQNCLRAANIKSIGELVRRDERDLLTFRNFGRKSLDELGKIVDSLGLSFGMDVDRYLEQPAEAH